MVQFRKRTGDTEWEIKRYPFGLWKLSCVLGKSKVWMAIFRELSHLDTFISTFEPSQTRAMAGSVNPYLQNAISEFMAGEIDQDQFTETAQVYGALPALIQAVIEEKNAEGFYDDNCET